MAKGAAGNMSDLRVGVIGASGRGGLAAHVEEEDPHAHLVAAADVDGEALDRFQERHGKDTFVTTDYRKMLDRDDIDAVFVCTPDHFHEEHAVAALKAGKAVYLEKPIAVTIEGADRILQTAKQTGSRLYLGHNMRYFPPVLKMKELLDAGVIGEIQAVWCRHFVSIGGDAYYKDWHSERKNSTGLLLQKGAHDIDVIHWLSDSYTASVVAMGRLSVYDRATRRKDGDLWNKKLDVTNWPPLAATDYSKEIDVEDHNMVLMQLKNGIQASYVQCHYTPDYWRNYTFIGTEGRIENIGDTGHCEVHVYTTRTHANGEPTERFELSPISGSHGGSDPAIVKAFMEFVRNGTIPNTSPVAARYAVAAGVMATESLRNGNMPRHIPELDRELVEYFERGQA